MSFVKQALTIFVLILSASINISEASSVSLGLTASGSAIDNTSNGSFDVLSPNIDVHAQVTNFANIYTVTRAMLEFDISSLSSPVSNASFDFNVTGLKLPNTTVDFWGYEGDGIVDLSDAYLGDVKMGSMDFFNTGTFSIDVTDYLNDSLAKSASYIGINLRMTNEYTSSIYGYSNEVNIIGYTAVPFYAPVLTVTTVPVPPAFFLLFSGLISFVFGSRFLNKNITKKLI